MPDIAEQIAALPMHWDKDGNLRILMVTSRETKRWVMPKGWEMDGKKPWRAAEIEALEEAGAVGRISREAIGTYTYLKRLDDGSALPCEVRVYPMIVQKLKRDWKERKERKRHWFTPRSAASKVQEAELSELLLTLCKKPKKDPTIRALLNRAS
ncbi:NUDIX hydrolase [Tropicibacter sp. S64]|uniref:NUDIX hydrolase n=1 Tax=Tropicibacter sp. S64 TaxID=3415122 RepID=UPI003C7A8EC6